MRRKDEQKQLSISQKSSKMPAKALNPHFRHDALSFDLHKALCEKLAANPEFLNDLIARNEWAINQSSGWDSELHKWKRTLKRGVEATISLACEKSERGQVMRSRSPFAAIVDQEWRLDFLDEWRGKWPTLESLRRHELFGYR